jgi:hypothetical protein
MPTFEEEYEKAQQVIQQNPKFKQVFIRLLQKCSQEPHRLDELEPFVQMQPGYEMLNQPPFFPIHWLEQSFMFEELFLDAEDNLYTQADLEGLSEDEFDDLITQYAFQTTEVGLAIMKEYDPKQRLSALFGETPERAEIYLDVLNLATTKRSLAEIDRRIRASDAFESLRSDAEVPLTPGMFVDKLAASGGIVFDKGWVITEEGKELIKVLQT